jgi:2-oxo-4-hydroxy-4-carboxy--5-ureidoimidazoline (OHCU) decarboxylase
VTRTNLTTLKQRIIDRYDTEYICDVLCITPHELLEAFEDRLEEMQDEFSELEDMDGDDE